MKNFNKYNLLFVPVALSLLYFGMFVFPEIWTALLKLEQKFPPSVMFFGAIFSAIGEHPVMYILGCVTYYAISIRIFKTWMNDVINCTLLATWLLGFGNILGVVSQ